MKIKYRDFDFRPATLAVIRQANEIIAEYAAEGFKLTLRQLYYQFVARDLLPNTQKSYSRLGSIINDARLAGLVDWNAIEDRTRMLRGNYHLAGPSACVDEAARDYRIDTWDDQEHRVEVWIEKDALAGIIERVCVDLDVDYFSCRGYVSQSGMFEAGQRHNAYADGGQTPVILHLGDHDPSGIDMTRDIADRMAMFTGDRTIVKRIALTMAQVEEHAPPPNPAKFTDSRAADYVAEYGTSSWELDALDPGAMTALIRQHVAAHCDEGLRRDRVEQQEREREELTACAGRWSEVVDFLEDV